MQNLYPKIKRILEDKLISSKNKTMTGKPKNPIEIYGANKKSINTNNTNNTNNRGTLS